MKAAKKLIEVALPLEAINTASSREKSIRHGHPSTLHLWWARRPLAAARAVIFSQMVDDPSARPDLFPTEKLQEKERKRLFRIMEDLVRWDNTNNERVVQQARDEILESWHRACAENADHPKADELFDRKRLPAFHDPFAGGGSLPLEAQRLGLDAYASDLNPVAVLICKAMIEVPRQFVGREPVNPEWQAKSEEKTLEVWKGAQGLAEDVRYYGQWMRNEAERRIGHLYPKIEVTSRMAEERPALAPLVGQKLRVTAWIWARTVKSPNPAYSDIDVPLASTFMLSTKKGKEVHVKPEVVSTGYRFTVREGQPADAATAKRGTKLAGANFVCLMSGSPISGDYIKAEGKAERMGARLMAIIAEGEHGRVHLAPSDEHEAIARSAQPGWTPDGEVPSKLTGGTCVPYGLTRWRDLFTERQLVALATFSELVGDARDQVKRDAAAFSPSSVSPGEKELASDAYANAVALYLGLGVGRSANYWSSLTPWGGEFIVQTFGRQALPMVWDHAEANPFSSSTGNWTGALDWIQRVMTNALSASHGGHATQADARTQTISQDKVVATDPPYFDNIAYADLSDFFYVWHRRALGEIFPDFFVTLAAPKAEELVAVAYRHNGSKKEAETFFLEGMTDAMSRLAGQAHPGFPVTIFYAFKQSETQGEAGTASTGWETFLDAIMRAGFGITGTWPVRTERDQGLKTGTNVLASSIVLVCRLAPHDAPTATLREFVNTLKSELPEAIAHLQRGNIAPVDLAQASIGPGMAIFTRYSKVLDATGEALPVRRALALINEKLDEALAQQEGDFDADTRWALAWFEQLAFNEGEYGLAETLSKAKNTSVEGMERAGILVQGRGRVRLLAPAELAEDWDPSTDSRLTAWEIVHQLVRALEEGGESAAAALLAKLGSRAEIARELAYRLFNLCERRKRATAALAYNALVQAWPELVRLAATEKSGGASIPSLFEG